MSLLPYLFFAAALIAYLGIFGFAWFVYDNDSVVFALVVAGLNLTLGTGLLIGLYDECFTDHPVFVLDKREWACSASHREQTTTYVKSGNVMVPVTSEHTVCDNYARIP